jgi:hypothetical protein
MRSWIWQMARAHKVNPENILEIKDSQFPEKSIDKMVFNNFHETEESAALYFRRALRHVWEL